jgi:hypothetical protein
MEDLWMIYRGFMEDLWGIYEGFIQYKITIHPRQTHHKPRQNRHKSIIKSGPTHKQYHQTMSKSW